jgi:ATP-binding cassette subfamily F protein uup
VAAPSAKPDTKKAEGLTFTERKRLEALPELMGKLEAEIAMLSTLIADPDLFARDPAKFAKATTAIAERQAALAAAEEEWLTLEERNG